MDMEYNEHVMKELPSLLLKGAMNAKQANELTNKDIYENGKCRDVALACLSAASAYMATARAIYVVMYDSIDDDSVDVVFARYDAFASELLTNYRTDHSHQWSGIEFERFEDAYSQRFGSIF